LIDLGVSIFPDAPHEPWKPRIHYQAHEGEGLDWVKNTFGVTEEDLVWSGGKGAAIEEATAITHAGRHVDAASTCRPGSASRTPAGSKTVSSSPWIGSLPYPIRSILYTLRL